MAKQAKKKAAAKKAAPRKKPAAADTYTKAEVDEIVSKAVSEAMASVHKKISSLNPVATGKNDADFEKMQDDHHSSLEPVEHEKWKKKKAENDKLGIKTPPFKYHRQHVDN